MSYQSSDESRKLRNAYPQEAKRTTAKRDSNEEISVSELWEILARRRVPIVACVALGVLAGVCVNAITQKVYESVTRISVSNQSPMSSGRELLAQAAGVVDPTTLQSEVGVIGTDALAWDVIRTLRLDQQRDALPQRFHFGPTLCQSGANQTVDSIGMECRQRILDEFHRCLHVEAVPRTNIIDIRYRSRSRSLSAVVANTISSLYVERSYRAKFESATKNSTWLSGQLDGVRKDAENAARRLITHEETTGAVGIDGGPNLVLSRLAGLSEQLIGAEADRMIKEARYRTALTGDPEALTANTQTLQVLHSQEAALRIQYAELDAQFGDAYPKVIQIKEQIAKVQDAVKTEEAHTAEKLKSEYDAAVSSEMLLRSEVEKQKQLVYNSTDAWVTMSMLNRDMEASGELYKLVSNRLRSGGIVAASNGPDITVIDPATIPFRQVEPHSALNILKWGAVGLLIALLLSALLEGLDPRIATLNTVAELCPVPGIGIIPCIRKKSEEAFTIDGYLNGRSELEVLDQPGSEAADAFRSLRTSLLYASTKPAPTVILVTSPLSGEGSTAASANLGAAFAQMNKSVLLVDADLRGDASNTTTSSTAGGGLAEALRGDDYRYFCVASPKHTKLIMLPAGVSRSNPSDVLDSARMRELIEQWSKEYDYVIVALPQLIGRSDAAILSTMVDTVVLTVRAQRGRRSDIERAMRLLESVGASLHGAVITDLRFRSLFAKTTSWHRQPITETRTEFRNA